MFEGEKKHVPVWKNMFVFKVQINKNELFKANHLYETNTVVGLNSFHTENHSPPQERNLDGAIMWHLIRTQRTGTHNYQINYCFVMLAFIKKRD